MRLCCYPSSMKWCLKLTNDVHNSLQICSKHRRLLYHDIWAVLVWHVLGFDFNILYSIFIPSISFTNNEDIVQKLFGHIPKYILIGDQTCGSFNSVCDCAKTKRTRILVTNERALWDMYCWWSSDDIRHTSHKVFWFYF